MKWYWIIFAVLIGLGIAAQTIGIVEFEASLPRETSLWMGLVSLSGGWMAFDGGRALIDGDYVTPSGGEMAGQLGPWSSLIKAVGIAPRSTLMKSIFLIYSLIYLGLALALGLGSPWAWPPLLVVAILGLWYVPFGTFLSILVIVLLMLPALRPAL